MAGGISQRAREEVRKRNFDGVTPVLPLRFTTASGHGIGKSVLVAFIVNWIMSTRPHAKGTVTANTFQQLSTRTWATIQTWTKRCVTGHWFVVTGERIFHAKFKDSWFCSAQSSKEENSEACDTAMHESRWESAAILLATSNEMQSQIGLPGS